ncbi:MAG: hypothetical protein J6Z03_07530 [Erysipelotrichaceae bacterium]|nr:hypothetical protein [Erysipelotrichaceae bacterium]
MNHKASTFICGECQNKDNNMFKIIIGCAIITLAAAAAIAVSKNTLIDNENRSNTPKYFTQKDEDGNDVIHPL